MISFGSKHSVQFWLGFSVFVQVRPKRVALHINAFGAISVTQAFLPLLAKAPAARIINVSSEYGQLNTLSASVPAAYGLSKLALNGATIMLADTLRSQGIAVYAMSPGWVRTEMGGAGATRSPEEGADTAIWLAQLDPN